MNTRVNSIVDSLLDLNEDINTRLPGLLTRFPKYTREEILQMAEADPTKDTRCEYITWLLNLRRAEKWDGTAEPVRDLLVRFDELEHQV